MHPYFISSMQRSVKSKLLIIKICSKILFTAKTICLTPKYNTYTDSRGRGQCVITFYSASLRITYIKEL